MFTIKLRLFFFNRESCLNYNQKDKLILLCIKLKRYHMPHYTYKREGLFVHVNVINGSKQKLDEKQFLITFFGEVINYCYHYNTTEANSLF